MPFLSPNQQCQSREGENVFIRRHHISVEEKQDYQNVREGQTNVDEKKT